MVLKACANEAAAALLSFKSTCLTGNAGGLTKDTFVDEYAVDARPTVVDDSKFLWMYSPKVGLQCFDRSLLNIFANGRYRMDSRGVFGSPEPAGMTIIVLYCICRPY